YQYGLERPQLPGGHLVHGGVPAPPIAPLFGQRGGGWRRLPASLLLKELPGDFPVRVGMIRLPFLVQLSYFKFLLASRGGGRGCRGPGRSGDGGAAANARSSSPGNCVRYFSAKATVGAGDGDGQGGLGNGRSAEPGTAHEAPAKGRKRALVKAGRERQP